MCGLAVEFWGLYWGRTLMGIFQAGIFPAATLILAVWYPASLRGTATAMLNSFMLLGGATGSAVVGYLLEPVGFPYLLSTPLSWRSVFLWYSLPGFVWAVWFFWWFRNRPEEHPSVNAAELALLRSGRESDWSKQADEKKPSQPLQPPWAATSAMPVAPPSVIASRLLLALPLMLLCTQQFFRAAAPRFFEARLPTYLETQRQLGPKEATFLAAWPQYAGVVGGLVGGILSDLLLRRTRSRYLARNGVAMFGLVLCLGWYLAAYFVADVYLACMLLAAGSFFFNFSSPAAYALVIDLSGKYLPVVFGSMNMAGNFGAYALVSLWSWMVALNGWELALSIWLSLHAVALVCWLLLNPSKSFGEGS
ncbi:MAG: MFS transporter, partial [Gemmataceae bacterium]